MIFHWRQLLGTLSKFDKFTLNGIYCGSVDVLPFSAPIYFRYGKSEARRREERNRNKSMRSFDSSPLYASIADGSIPIKLAGESINGQS
jgi:hypothetical protein